MKRLIVTGDDFGLAVPVNEAIVEAHQRGILTTASLMVGGEAAGDAVERARSLPSLRVGLHLVVVEGRPVLSPGTVPGLVDARGELPPHLARAGFRFFFLPAVRKQLRAEIRAQFEAFRKTGLPLDHVNAHNHMHLHPTVLNLILETGREYGMTAIRCPFEPPMRSRRASGKPLAPRFTAALLLSPWIRYLKRRCKQLGLKTNSFVFGMADTGAMTEKLVLSLLREIPEGVTEIYFHPAAGRCAELDRTMAQYRHRDELKALTSPRVMESLQRRGIHRITFDKI